jgi:hypothetical protein
MTSTAEKLAGLRVLIDFDDGLEFRTPFILNDPAFGLLNVGELAGPNSLTVNYTSRTTGISIRRGRDVLQDDYNAGSATVRILDPDGDFNPQNVDSPIFGYVTTNKKLRISHFDDTGAFGVTTALFTGYISDYKYTFPTNQETSYVPITAYDAFKILNTAAITTVTGAAAGDTTAERITQILDEVDVPASMQIINSSTVTCQADNGSSRSGLTAIRFAEITENGAFYIDPMGDIRFLNREQVYDSYDPATLYVFSNDDFVAAGYPYQNVKFAFDDKRLYNQGTITRAGGTAQTYSDAASIAEYFTKSYTQSNLLMETDAEALLLAEGYIEARKDNDIRIDALTVDVLGSIIWLDFLSFDYFQTINIVNVTPQGSIVQKILQIQGIAHDITPSSWNITFTTLEPLIVSEYWL